MVEKRYIRKDGEVRWVRSSVTPGPANSGRGETLAAIVEDITAHKQALAALEEAHTRLRDLSAMFLRIEETSRRRVAQELHDGAAQLLTALSMHLALARNPPANVGAEQLLEDSMGLADRCATEIRTVLFLLQPASGGADLAEAIRSYAAGYSRRTGVAVDVRIGPVEPATEFTTRVFLRVVQDWLANVRRDAHGAGLAITLRSRNGETVLELLDTSAPDVMPDLSGFGARAELLGGRVEVERLERGTLLTFRAPAV